MDPKDYQKWLNYRGAGIAADGAIGPATRAATKKIFTNTNAKAVSEADIAALAAKLGCTVTQLRAVANVESSGSGYDNDGRPKILFERHKFHSFTGGKYGISSYSSPSAGGYAEDSWEKLAQALSKDVDAAFKSVSWGKFQVMGFWFPDMGFSSPLELAYSTVLNEANHYALFSGYIHLAKLQAALRKVSKNPDDCRAFAAGYNGTSYEKGSYHIKIAREMGRLS